MRVWLEGVRLVRDLFMENCLVGGRVSSNLVNCGFVSGNSVLLMGIRLVENWLVGFGL